MSQEGTKIKIIKNNFLLIKLIWEALGNKLKDLYDMKVYIILSNNEVGEFKPFARHYFEQVFENGHVPKYLPNKYNNEIGVDKKYFEGEKAFDPGLEIGGENYHEKCDEYWKIIDDIRYIKDGINEKNDTEKKKEIEKLKSKKEQKKKVEKELLEFARKLLTMLNTTSSLEDDLFKLIIFLESRGKVKIDDISKAMYRIMNLTKNIQKLKLEDLLKANIKILEEYKKVLTLQSSLVDAAIILLKTDKDELNNCINALSAVAKQGNLDLLISNQHLGES
jgi:hypothetical protein